MLVPKRKQRKREPILKIITVNRWLNREKIKRGFIDPFGHLLFLKGILMSIIGWLTYRRFNGFNKVEIEGMDVLEKLPQTNVLFVSNHNTYYTDVILFYHLFCAAKWGHKNINRPYYLLSPRVRSYFVAAEETMKESGWLPKLFMYAGAVTVKRSWKHKDQKVQRGIDPTAEDKIDKALGYGWVVTFPQGTVRPNAPIRKGAAHMIKAKDPLVVPVHIDGLRDAFDKTGLKIRNKGVKMSVKFGDPMQFSKYSTVDQIYKYLDNNIREKEVKLS